MHIAWIFSNTIFPQGNLRKKKTQKKLKKTNNFLLKFYQGSDLFWAYFIDLYIIYHIIFNSSCNMVNYLQKLSDFKVLFS